LFVASFLDLRSIWLSVKEWVQSGLSRSNQPFSLCDQFRSFIRGHCSRFPPGSRDRPMKRPCLGYPGHQCGRLVAGANRCEDCQRAQYQVRNHARPPGERAFYGSPAWKRLATAAVEEADRCATCGTSKEYAKLTGGHLVSIRARPDLALEPGNVVAQCVPCQSRMKQRPDPATWQRWERSPRTSRW
jgi:hypothetical protein